MKTFGDGQPAMGGHVSAMEPWAADMVADPGHLRAAELFPLNGGDQVEYSRPTPPVEVSPDRVAANALWIRSAEAVPQTLRAEAA